MQLLIFRYPDHRLSSNTPTYALHSNPHDPLRCAIRDQCPGYPDVTENVWVGANQLRFRVFYRDQNKDPALPLDTKDCPKDKDLFVLLTNYLLFIRLM